MFTRIKPYLQYVVILALTVLLVWLSLRNLHVEEGTNKLDYLLHTWEQAHKGWLLLMAGLAFLSHIIRAQRWRMLLAPTGNHLKLTHSFYSLMIGYLVNLVIPRGGEVSRCYNLYKLDKIPADVSFGTVVIERIVDVLCLLTLLLLSFALESAKVISFVETLPISLTEGTSKIKTLSIAGFVVVAFTVAAWFVIRRNQKLNAFIVKTIAGFRQGLSSVFRLENKILFILFSITIWLLYYMMSYAVIKAFPTTNLLGFDAVLTLFAIGSIAMAAPLPGGTGSYHVLVPQGLFFLYQIPLPEAVAFTFVFHGWQTLIVIVGGAASLLVSSYIIRKKNTYTS